MLEEKRDIRFLP
jgi:TatD DNase family protein